MKRSLLAAALLLATLTPAAFAGYGSEDPRLHDLYTSFVAPCCWRDNLAIHESGKADQARADIKAMVAAGRSDEQIRAAMVQQYGKRILVVPEGGAATWLFKTPWLLAVLGLAVVVMFLRRMRHAAPQDTPVAAQTK